MKKLLVLSSIILVFSIITGCGSSGSVDSSAQPSSTNQTSTATSEDDAKKKAEEEAKKKEEEAKAKAEEEANAKEAAELEKYKTATYLSLFIPKLDEINGNEAGVAFPTETVELMKSKIDLFPATGEKVKELKQLVDKNVEYKHLSKNITKYTGTMFSDEGYVISIEEVDQTDIGSVSVLHVMNDDQNSYQIVYPGSLDIFEEDYVEFVGVPTIMSGFDNVSGGYTNIAMIVGSYVGKIE